MLAIGGRRVALRFLIAPRLRTRVGSRGTAATWPPLVLSCPSEPLLEFLNLLLQETAGNRFLPVACLVVAAIGAAPPAFGIRFLAGRAEDAPGQRHRGGALYTSVVNENRRKTLETLITLAESSNPASCWDDERAESLLRSQSTPAELRELGTSETMIERLFGAEHADRGPRTADREARPAGSFTVRVEARFEAAHYLREYRGISEPLHGHSYKVEADLAAKGGGIDSDAIAVDFISARAKLEALAKKLDYGCINEVPPFDAINPSAENIAQWFHRELSQAIANEGVVRAITVWEGPVNSVTFVPQSPK